MLELINITKSYATKKGITNLVLQKVSLHFNSCGLVFFLGKSGAGKTTLLNIIGGLDRYDSGDLLWEGKSTKKFKQKDFDQYRNGYLGFIFQDFNLMEDYTVLENIILAKELQNKKINSNELNSLLERLEISTLKNRKINELSGGQKQRVAIARALIKKPKLILADEPTGNLDSITGNQVMKILKEISKDTLVIVVSHDREMASSYGDCIIELEDGQVISCIGQTTVKENNYNINSRVKMPVKKAIQLGLISLKTKKWKLFFTMFLMTLSTLFLLLFGIMLTYDVNDNHMKLIKEKGTNALEIRKYTYNPKVKGVEIQTGKVQKSMNSKDTEIILNKVEGYPIYQLEDSPIYNFLKLNYQVSNDIYAATEQTDLYTQINSSLSLIECEEAFIEKSIVGSFPKNNQEIMISNYLAQMIIKYGIYEYGTNIIYYPKTIEEIIQFNKNYSFGQNNSVKIVGIIEYDLSLFEPLKNKTLQTATVEENDLFKKLNQNIRELYAKVYVKKGFVDSLKKKESTKLDPENTYQIMKDKTMFPSSNFNVLNQKIEYFDGEKFKTINHLNSNQIIVGVETIVPNYYDYMSRLQAYIEAYPNQNPTILEQEFFLKNVSYKEYLNKMITLSVYEDKKLYFELENQKPTQLISNIEIVGITGFQYSNNYGNYLSKELVSDYQEPSVKILGIILPKKELTEIHSIMKRYPYNGKYALYTSYSMDVEMYYNSMLYYREFLQIGASIFFLFSVLLIGNFISSSITSQKKKIGILKALGARNIDIIWIFMIEGILLSFLVTIITTVLSYFLYRILNTTLLSVTNLMISPFYLQLDLILFTLGYLIILVLLSSIVPLFKIVKMKPVDAIYNHK